MYSFDIFDTLITRTTYSSYGIFLIMQERLRACEPMSAYSEYLLNNFAALRREAEKNARNFNREKEISLIDIYRVMAQMAAVSEEKLKQLMDLEIQMEVEYAVEIESGTKKIMELCEKKESVVLISDTYFSESDLRYILKKINPIYHKLPLYVSSEYGCTKQEGLLYLEVKRREKISSYKTWTHYGSNYISDVNIPAMLGIKTVYTNPVSFTSWENHLKNSFDLSRDLSLQMILGTIKVIRQKNTLNMEKMLGVSLGGILLFPYVDWILKQCVELGINRLYFIARDGYVLKQIADLYISEYCLDVRTKYIYGSRNAWRVTEKSKQETVRGYILQEIDFSDNKFAFVDIAGTGQSIACLVKILKTGTKWNVFYHDMIEPVQDESCVFGIYRERVKRDFLEALCKAPHGATMGYQNDGNRYIPVLSGMDEKRWKKCGLEEFFQGVLIFVKEWIHNTSGLNGNINIKPFEDFLTEYLCNAPDTEIASFIGDLQHDSFNTEEKKYAPALTKKEIFQIFMWRTSEETEQYYQGSDLNYSLFRMGAQEKRIKEFYENNYTRLLGKIIHFYKNLFYRQGKYFVRKRIVIYAAGKWGKELYNAIHATPGMRVIGWTDADYAKYQKSGLPVKKPEEVLRMDFDFLIIAIKNKSQANTVKKLLLETGIESRKIMQREEFYSKYFSN